jgi:hypothetical protein
MTYFFSKINVDHYSWVAGSSEDSEGDMEGRLFNTSFTTKYYISA